MFEKLNGKVVPVYVVDDIQQISLVIEKLKGLSINVVEVTLRTAEAFEAIKLIKANYPEMIVGAGTVLTTEQLEQAIRLEVDFAVAPGLNPVIAQCALDNGLPFMPGVATPSEIEQAISMGFKHVKLFPIAALGGMRYLKALTGPYKNLQFMPTGGIKSDDVDEYLAHDQVFCVGGSWMI